MYELDEIESRQAGPEPDTGVSPGRGGAPDRPPAISISGLTKTYDTGFQALHSIDLEVRQGEIFALLGPNGAGKTTLINLICGTVTPSGGQVLVEGHDILREYRETRSRIGLVPQELTTEAFETVWATVSFSRGLFGKPRDPAHIEKVLRDLALWDKRNNKIMTLSGGMKRRLLIAKALAHEPRILFLDEPTAGVDVDLRHEMWELVRHLREGGVTVILTTHYIEEAELMADRVGVINNGRLVLVDEKDALMRKLGRKRLTLHLERPLERIPAHLDDGRLELGADGCELTYTYDAQEGPTGIADLLTELTESGIRFTDLHTEESSLEDIFVSLVREER
ncbi:MAG TPA: ABC transporter ATP-binding protein [Gammaproteobacteria bacterium]|nr:ABC transporter ATP-binding protein [Gammaproteobacteria bacterium]